MEESEGERVEKQEVLTRLIATSSWSISHCHVPMHTTPNGPNPRHSPHLLRDGMRNRENVIFTTASVLYLIGLWISLCGLANICALLLPLS